MDPLNLFPSVQDNFEADEIAATSPASSSDASPEGISPIPIPIPFPIIKNSVSGRYRGTVGTYQLELRVDVDGTRPTNRLSGDFYTVSGGVTTYFGSLKSGIVTAVWTATSVTITGTMTATWSTTANNIKVTIPRTNIFQVRAAATITFYSGTVAGTTYVCPFESIYFRTVKLEIDTEAGASIFGSYNTGTLPHGGTARSIDVVSSYAEAGVQMALTGGTDIVPSSAAGADVIWTNAELEAAMHGHFSIVSDSAKWQTYLLSCKSKHEFTTGGSTLFGIMFDYSGTFQRQGCAVFQTQVNSYYGGAGSNDANRHMIYCYVHELGHSFNLLHSWDKGRSSSLSWMNYDWKYDSINGAGSFWGNFAFQFDDQELIHVRHGYRNNVIQGGDNWNVNAGLSKDEIPSGIPDVIENNSGLAFELEAKPTFLLGEPVVIELKVKLRDLNGKTVNATIHPNYEFSKIAIKKPSGEIVLFEGLADHFLAPKMVKLNEQNPTIYESAYIGYGKDGFYFNAPGVYSIKGAYLTAEGTTITSNEIKVRVKSPLSAADDAIADLYLGEEQGRLFYLMGSDAAHLQQGNEAFDTVLAQYPEHPLSAYSALIKGVNAARDFKTIAEKQIAVREHDTKKAHAMSSKVLKMSKSKEGVDNITLNYALRKTAESQIKNGDKKAAQKTMNDMRSFFESQNLKAAVMTRIDTQIAKVLDATV